MNPFKLPALHRQHLHWLLQLSICAIGAGLLWYASVWGVGISPDSAEYIAAARRLHSLGDLFNLPAQWAPGYPVLLKLAYLFNSNIPGTTRVLQCLLLAGNLAAAMALLRHVSSRTSLLPELGGVVLLTAFNLWEMNFYAWSEGPFLICQQLGVLCLLRYLEQPERLSSLILAAALAALALLFRYAGIAFVGAASLLLLLLAQGNWQRRLRTACTFGCMAVLPFLLWIVANHFIRHETTNRQFVVHLPGRADLLTLLGQILSWFGLDHLNLLSLVSFLLGLVVLRLALRNFPAVAPRLRWLVLVSLCYAGVYVVFILFSKSFFDAYIPFDERIFAPAWLFTFLTLLACALQLLTDNSQRVRLLAVVALLFMAVTGSLRMQPVISNANAQGIGYYSAYMSQVSKVEEVKQLADKIVYTNAPDYLRMQTDFTIQDYPRKFAPTTNLANPDYQQQLATMLQQVQAGQALLVHYQGFEWRSYFPTYDELGKLGYQSILTGKGVRILSHAVADDKATQ